MDREDESTSEEETSVGENSDFENRPFNMWPEDDQDEALRNWGDEFDIPPETLRHIYEDAEYVMHDFLDVRRNTFISGVLMTLYDHGPMDQGLLRRICLTAEEIWPRPAEPEEPEPEPWDMSLVIRVALTIATKWALEQPPPPSLGSYYVVGEDNISRRRSERRRRDDEQ